MQLYKSVTFIIHGEGRINLLLHSILLRVLLALVVAGVWRLQVAALQTAVGVGGPLRAGPLCRQFKPGYACSSSSAIISVVGRWKDRW